MPDDIISGADALERFLKRAGEDPRATALFCDLDGTVSPIAPRPSEAVVPERSRTVLRALVARLGLVAFVTGRTLEDGRRLAGVDGAAYVGLHGLEVRERGGELLADPRAEQYVPAIRAVAERAARELGDEDLGVVLEDKRLVLAIHYRLARDPATTRHEILSRVVEPARASGLAIATGHFSFEVRPPLPFTKGAAVKRLLAAGDYLSALACGDDLTDVTAFAAVHRWRERDARRAGCAVAAVTAETPRPVLDEADVRVRATGGIHRVLTRLAAAG